MMKTNSAQNIFVGVALLALLAVTSVRAAEMDRVQVAFRTVTAHALVADEPQERNHGLSDTPGLCADCGMLFVYAQPQILRFVMRDMRYPLDFIWIDGDRVIGVTENAPPEGSIPTALYLSPQMADKVLEVNAGFCAAHAIRPGDRVRIVPEGRTAD